MLATRWTFSMDKSIILEGFVLDSGTVVDPPRPVHSPLALPESLLPLITKQKEVTFPLWFDNTARSAFSLCRRKGYYGHFRTIAPLAASEHLIYGGAYARGLEVARTKFYGEGVEEDEAIVDGLAAAWKEYGDYTPPDNSIKTFDNLGRAYVDYFRVHPMDGDYVTPYKVDGKPCVEFTFAVPIPDTIHPETGDPILYVGRFDMLGEFKSGIWVVDDKTATTLGPQWVRQWDLNPQMTGYTWACHEYGFPVMGAIIRGNSAQTNEVKHKEAIVYKKPWQIDQWLERLVHDVNEAIDCWKRSEWPPVLNDACNMYGGCPYRDLCLSREPEQIILTHYKHRQWDPLEQE